MPAYRPNVALVLTRSGGEILICERSDFPECWQFPQGGIKHRESPEEALQREVREEISLRRRDYRILRQCGPYRYDFPPGCLKEGCIGQEQTYFLAELLDSETPIRVDRREFRDFRWIFPTAFRMAWIPPIKRAVYRNVFRDLFDLELPASADSDTPHATTNPLPL